MNFPKGFLWGAASAAHQVEGGQRNDWTEWEAANAPRLAEAAAKLYASGESVWQDVGRLSTKPENYVSGRAADHYNRYEEDFDIAQSLGLKALRISIEWSRIEPEAGRYDQRELDHYADVVAALVRRGIEPVVTLWHFSLPLWFRDQGGWPHPQAARQFARYASRIAEALPGVRYWVTLNEPEIYAAQAYVMGRRPPQRHSPLAYLRVMRSLVRAHRLAYAAVKKVKPDAQVGLAKDCFWFQVDRPTILNRALKAFLDRFRNYSLFYALRNSQDFLGINYYVRFTLDAGWRPLKSWVRDSGWEHSAEGLVPLLLELRRFGKPILITENGTIDREDGHRARFLRETIAGMERALAQGAPLIGYLHWSLTDNFDWESGRLLAFGLVEIDFGRRLARTIRPSAQEYGRLIAEHSGEQPLQQPTQT